jgi:hypothetical protein
MFLSLNNSNGVCASSSPTISPNAVESSSLIGASRDAGRIETVFNRESFALEIPISSASSSSVGSRPNPSLRLYQQVKLRLDDLERMVEGRNLALKAADIDFVEPELTSSPDFARSRQESVR